MNTIKLSNKCAIKHQTREIRNFILANRWILDIQSDSLLSEASVYAEHHDAEMVKLVDTLA
ncbi:hypothetical protein [Vibrio alfacsensis]|uniref:hypothetical protein n=1 Tax=Vibrio alfacsensis TaxID=1074311 RepID=UPI004068CD14